MSIISDIATEEHDMEMTPMIDVVFLLLIFFLCTLKFKTLEGKLSAFLPKDVGVNTTEAEPIEKVEILLEVVHEGKQLKTFKQGQPWNEVPGTRFLYRFMLNLKGVDLLPDQVTQVIPFFVYCIKNAILNSPSPAAHCAPLIGFAKRGTAVESFMQLPARLELIVNIVH